MCGANWAPRFWLKIIIKTKLLSKNTIFRISSLSKHLFQVVLSEHVVRYHVND